MEIIQAPTLWYGGELPHPRPWIFLAGSIEMGTAPDWQRLASHQLLSTWGTILNPRRDDCDNSWLQTIENVPFRKQVEWELHALELCDVALFYFAPNTQSPISLMELGLFHHKAVVCCPEGFWRKGNVDIVCKRYGTPLTTSLEVAIQHVRGTLKLEYDLNAPRLSS